MLNGTQNWEYNSYTSLQVEVRHHSNLGRLRHRPPRPLRRLRSPRPRRPPAHRPAHGTGPARPALRGLLRWRQPLLDHPRQKQLVCRLVLLCDEARVGSCSLEPSDAEGTLHRSASRAGGGGGGKKARLLERGDPLLLLRGGVVGAGWAWCLGRHQGVVGAGWEWCLGRHQGVVGAGLGRFGDWLCG